MRRRAFLGAAAAGTMVGANPPASPLRLGIAGLVHGHAAGFLARYRDSRDVELVGVAEPDAEVAARYVARHRLQGYAHANLPAEPLPDAVVEADEAYQNAGEKVGD